VKKNKVKSFCKINLTLKVLKRLSNGYHSISSLITFCGPRDVISVTETKNIKDKISFSGRFKKGIDSELNTISAVLNLLRKTKLIKNKFYKISIQKNIPHGSGLGSGSSNAADLLNYFNIKLKLKLTKNKKEKLARKIGFDTPISLERKNTFLTGKKESILRFNKKFRLNILIVYPNLICSTKEIYKKNKKFTLLKTKSFSHRLNKKNLIDYLKKNSNDLEETVTKLYPKIKDTIDFIKAQKGCYFSRITGSGSACIGIFSNKQKAVYAQKMIKIKYPKYWCVASKTI